MHWKTEMMVAIAVAAAAATVANEANKVEREKNECYVINLNVVTRRDEWSSAQRQHIQNALM